MEQTLDFHIFKCFFFLKIVGLPHAHVLLILSPEDKPTTIEDINRIVSAEIPDHIHVHRLIRPSLLA